LQSKLVPRPVERVGASSNLELGTWNLELTHTPQPESFRYLLILTGPTDPDKQI